MVPRIVVSEGSRQVQRDESYSSTPGPAIPGGLMHGMGRHADTTSCGQSVVGRLHVWPALAFPRSYGPHCQECLDTSTEDSEPAQATLGDGSDGALVAAVGPEEADGSSGEVLDLTGQERQDASTA